MNKNFIGVAMFFIGFTGCLVAQNNKSDAVQQLDEVVISDSKFELSREKSGKIISVISARDIANNPGQSIATLLNTVAGIEINGHQNGAGKDLGVFMRGGRSRQVLVMIDGVPVTDGSQISFQYDLRLLSADQVERVEILRGASSVLYGSGAATGVINIVLKKAKSETIAGSAYVRSGSNNTFDNKNQNNIDFNSGFSVNGRSQKVNYLFGADVLEMNGISQVANSNNQIFEADRMSRKNVMAKIGVDFSTKFNIDFFGNIDRIYNDYDGFYDNTGASDTKINNFTSRQQRFGFIPKYKYKKGEFVLNNSFSNTNRNFAEFSSFNNKTFVSDYKSRSVNVDGFNKYVFSNKMSAVLGVQYQFHDMGIESTNPFGDNVRRENAKFNMVDPYLNFVYTSDFGLNLNAGARLNNHSQYGNQLVYNVNPSYKFDAIPLKLLASVGTAFITPGLYQLYSQYSNLNLTPERNRTIEAGFETSLLSKKLRINSVAFFREQNNFIGFFTNPVTFAGNYVNIEGETKAKGVETEVRFVATDKITFNANYTFTEVDDALKRLIPKHKINAAVDYQVTSRFNCNVNWQYTDQRNDAFFDGNTFKSVQTVLGAYRLINSTIQYKLIPNRLNVFANVTNATNEAFIENVGFSTRGRNFRFGVDLKF